MLQIDDKIISLDLLEEYFACNLNKCFGLCCYEGDSGAPLEKQEIRVINNVLPKILKYLPQKNKKIIENSFFEYDQDGDLVIKTVEGKECVFAIKQGKIYKCAFEIAYEKKEIDFKKPISCHLFPIRVKKYENFTAVNFVKIKICQTAFINGKRKNIKAYEFLKDAIIRKFGKDFYEKLDFAAKNLKIEKL